MIILLYISTYLLTQQCFTVFTAGYKGHAYLMYISSYFQTTANFPFNRPMWNLCFLPSLITGPDEGTICHTLAVTMVMMPSGRQICPVPNGRLQLYHTYFFSFPLDCLPCLLLVCTAELISGFPISLFHNVCQMLLQEAPIKVIDFALKKLHRWLTLL